MFHANLPCSLQVVSCSTMWPQIVELHLECNEITSITTPPEHVFGKLEVLNLTGNGIKEWKHILSLSKLPRYFISVENTTIIEF